jgi:PAS domain S-box-containing protein
MEHPLSRSATWLSSVLEASLSGVLVFEPVPDASGQVADYRAVFANRAVGELIGTTPDLVLGTNLGNLFPNDAVLRLHFDRVVTRGEAQRFEFEHHNSARPGLGRTWFDASVNGLDGHVVMSFIDVTATRQVESQAEKTIARLHSILDGSPAAIGLLEAVRDPNDSGRITDFTIVSLNEQFCSLMKYEAADLIGRRFRKLFKRSLTAKLYDRFVRVVQTGVPLHEELHFERGPLQGWFDLTAVRQGDGLTITVLDVTDYREAEEKAQQSALMLETVLDRAQAGVTWHHAVRNEAGDIEDFQVVAINQASAEFFARINPALRGQALEGWRLSKFFPQAWDLGLFDRFVNVVETGEPVRYERTYPTAEGELWFDVSAVKEDDGLILTFVDITRSKEAELEAEATAELLGGVFDASPWAIVYLDPVYDADGDVVDFIFQLANAKAGEIGRLPLPTLVGGRMLDMYPHTRTVGLFEEYVRVLETGRPFEREVFFEQGTIAVWSHITAVRQGGGLVLTNSDVTARKLAEIQNEESLRLLQGVLTSAPTAIFWLEAVRDPADPVRIVDFSFALFNAYTAELARRPATDLHARQLLHLFPHFENTGLFADYVRVVETGQPFAGDVFYDWDGVHGWFHVQAARHDDGVVVQTLDITERKRAEEETLRLKDELARRAEDKYRALFGSIDQGLCVLEMVADESGEFVDYRYTDVNPAFEKQTGLTNVLGRTIREIQPRFDPVWVERYGRVALTGEPFRTEAFIPTLEQWFEVYAFRTNQLEDRHVAVLFSNITERKQHEQRQEFLLKLSDALRAEPDADAVANRALPMLAEHLRLDRCYIAVYRLEDDHADITHQVGNDRVPPLPAGGIRLSDFPEAFRVVFDRTLVIDDFAATGGLSDTDRRNIGTLGLRALLAATLRQGENNPHWVLVAVSASPRHWTGGEIALIEEVTERTWAAMERARAEAALRESKSRLQLIADLVPDLLWSSEPNGSTTWYNHRWLEYTGQSLADALDWGWLYAIHPDDREGSARYYREAIENGEKLRQEHRIRRDDGEYRWFVVNAFPLKDESGKVIKVYGAATDIHESRLMNEALRESEEKYRSIFENIDEGFGIQEVVTDENGNVTDVIYREGNGAFERFTGIKDGVGKKVSEILPHLEQAWLDALTQVYKTGKPLRAEDYTADLNRWFSYYYSRIGEAGSPLIAAVFNDITERKQRERQQEYLLNLSDALRPLSDAVEIQRAAMRVLGEHLQVDRVLYAEVDPDGQTYFISDNYVREANPKLIGRFSTNDFGKVSERLRAGETFAVEDMTSDERLSEAARAAFIGFNVYASVGVPLIKGGRWVANLGIQHGQAREWTEAEIALVQETAERTWAAVERARAEEELARSEEKYRTLFGSIDEGFCLVEVIFNGENRAIDYQFIEINAVFERQTGVKNAVGKRATELTPNIRPGWIEAIGDVALTGKPLRTEGYFEDLDRWYFIVLSRVGGAGSQLVVGVFDDITERKRREANQTLLVEIGDDLARLTTPDEMMQAVGERLCAALGLTNCLFADVSENGEEISVHQGWNRQDVPSLKQTYRVAEYLTPGHSAQELVVVCDTATDARVDAESYARLNIGAFVTVPFFRNGRWTANFGVSDANPREWTSDEIELFKEIGDRIFPRIERARTEVALAESEARLRLATEAARMYAWEFDFHTQTPRFAANYEQVTGLKPSATFAENLQLIHPDDQATVTAAFARAIAGDGTFEYEMRSLNSAGGLEWFHVSGLVLRDAAGQPMRAVGITQNITERKKAEAALRESEERLRIIIEGAQGYAIFTLTTDGRVDSWNAGAAAIFGWNEADILGQKSEVLFTPEDRAADVPRMELMTAATEGVAPDVRWHLRRDGSRVFINGINQALLDAGGQLRGFVKIGRDVTAQHEAETALRESETRLRLAIDAADMGTWEWHLPTDEVYWNERHFALFGMTPRPNPLKPGDFFDHVHPDDRERVGAELQRAIAERSVFDSEFRAAPESGNIRWISGYGRVTEEAYGQPTRLSGVMLDVTERKQAEEQLRDFAAELERQVAERTAELRKNLTLLQQTEGVALMGSWAYTPATGVFEWSEGMYRLFGLEPGTPVSPEVYLEHTIEADRPVAERIVDFLKHPDGHELQEQFRIRTPEGEKTIRIKATVQRNAAGEPERALGVDIDITAQVRAERQLSESARTLRNILDGAQAGIALLRAVREHEGLGPVVDFVVENANHLAAELNGIPMEQTLNRRLSELFPHYKAIGLFDRYVEVVESGVSQRFEARNEGPGPVEWFDVSLGKHGDGLVLTFSDISDLKHLQLQYYTQATMLEGILESSANSLGVYDAVRDERGQIVDFRVRLFNRAALQAARLTWADVEGKTLLQLSPYSQEIGVFHAAVEVVETGQPQQLTRDYPHLGKSFSIALSRFNRDGLVVGSVDITELRKAQRHQEELLEDLRKSNLNLEQFAYVTSHDLQEPLRKIQSFGAMLAKRLGDRLDPTEADLIHRMQDAATRMKTLIEDLLTFSRLSTKKEAFRWLQLDRLVREVLNDLESTIQEKNAIVHVGPLPRLKGDAMQWRQLLQNLLSNALKFSRPGVRPEVRVEARTVSAPDCPDVSGLRASQTYWEFTVADNGIGFDDQYREKIFDMFQRLHGRAEYSGTGIGLAIAKKVAEQHGGCVSAHGVPGQGATFRVYVPTPPGTAEPGD